MLKAISSKQTIEAEKNEVAIKLLSIKDKKIVHAIHVLVDDLTTSNYKRTSISQYNKDIDNAVQRVRNGKSISNEEAVKQLDTL